MGCTVESRPRAGPGFGGRCRSNESIEAFLIGVRPKLHRLLRSAGIPEQDAEDLIQNTLLALVYRWDAIHNPEAWIVGAIKKNCLMYWRSRRRRIYDTVDSPVLEWLAGGQRPVQERRDLEKDLDHMMERIPPRYRTVLRLRFGLGYKPSEVAKRMGYRRSSIGKVTARSLAALNREMIDAGFLDGL